MDISRGAPNSRGVSYESRMNSDMLILRTWSAETDRKGERKGLDEGVLG